ncbi:unnamed protein product [Prorocentrum cordatum]|uniref:Protein kinase domain-containing protein n=1 Tax=Prorocentrum cordatum TaxID=2364126 RepID=A0ABN9U0X8_9DINO|nr:unnamed protein product [Polarella glacialis]
MRALKDQMKKMNPFISTKTLSISLVGPEDDSAPRLWRIRTPKASKQGQPRKEITKISDSKLRSMYEVEGQVMESIHPGAEVILGRRLSSNEEVVVKTRDKSASFHGPADEREWRETTTTQLNMPKIENMCEYIAVYETRDKYYIVMERVKGMDLFEHLKQGQIRQEDARQILFQMLQALEEMHACGRIHKDLKLENVVVNLPSPRMCSVSSNGFTTSAQVKLIDFDTAQDWETTSPKAKVVVGTAGYIAPEAYSGDYSPASDNYGVGVIMYKLLTGRFPTRREIFDSLPGENWVGSPAMKRIQDRLTSERVDFTQPPLDQLPDARDLVKKLLASDASERPSAAGALRHPWFQHADSRRHGSRSASSKSTTAGSSSASHGECRESSSSWITVPQWHSEAESTSLPGELA